MKDLPRETEARILAALESAVKLANDGMTPDEALTKVAEDEKFTPQITQRIIEAFNISKTLNHLKKSAESERASSFPIASPENVLGAIWPEEPETAAKVAAEQLHTDYIFPKAAGDFMATDRIRDLPALTDEQPEPYAADPGALARRAIDGHNKLWTLYKQAKDAYREMFFRLYGQIDKAAAYWRQLSPEVSFEEADKRAYACFGEVGRSFMDLAYTAGRLGDRPLLTKRAESLPTTQMSFDKTAEPYSIIDDAVFLSEQLIRLAKEASEVEATMHEHALCNFDRLPPQPVEAAIDFFMPKAAKDMPSFTAQDRPKKVKEIYKAIKREHPGMPAEMKARIAARRGSSSPKKRKAGPPYKGKLARKKAAPLDEFVRA